MGGVAEGRESFPFFFFLDRFSSKLQAFKLFRGASVPKRAFAAIATGGT